MNNAIPDTGLILILKLLRLKLVILVPARQLTVKLAMAQPASVMHAILLLVLSFLILVPAKLVLKRHLIAKPVPLTPLHAPIAMVTTILMSAVPASLVPI